MDFPGMFPHAAGKIASNGPYSNVKEIYKIDGITDNDVKLFKKYEKYFTVLPPGRAFDERINECKRTKEKALSTLDTINPPLHLTTSKHTHSYDKGISHSDYSSLTFSCYQQFYSHHNHA